MWFYVPILLGGLLPATLLLPAFVRFLLSGKETAASARSPALGFMLLAGGWCGLFFTLSGCKLPTYILPAFPFLALALGAYLVQSRWVQSRWTWGILGLSLTIMASGHYLFIPWYAQFRSPMRLTMEVIRLCSDSQTPVVCYPRNCDSVAFYLGREDIHTYRSKETHLLVGFLQQHPGTVVLFAHRHSLKGFEQALESMSPDLHLTHITPLGESWTKGFETEFCYMAVAEKRITR